MRRCIALFALGLSACPRADEKPRPAAVSVPAASSVGVEPAPAAERGPSEAILIGTLNRLGTKICKSIDTADWQDVHLRAGLVRLEGNVRGLEALRGSPVILFGSVVREARQTSLAIREPACRFNGARTGSTVPTA